MTMQRTNVLFRAIVMNWRSSKEMTRSLSRLENQNDQWSVSIFTHRYRWVKIDWSFGGSETSTTVPYLYSPSSRNKYGRLYLGRSLVISLVLSTTTVLWNVGLPGSRLECVEHKSTFGQKAYLWERATFLIDVITSGITLMIIIIFQK